MKTNTAFDSFRLEMKLNKKFEINETGCFGNKKYIQVIN